MFTTNFEISRTTRPLRRRVIQHCAKTRFITFVVCSEMRVFKGVATKMHAQKYRFSKGQSCQTNLSILSRTPKMPSAVERATHWHEL